MHKTFLLSALQFKHKPATNERKTMERRCPFMRLSNLIAVQLFRSMQGVVVSSRNDLPPWTKVVACREWTVSPL